jgi:ribose transport system substrate-binding protein
LKTGTRIGLCLATALLLAGCQKPKEGRTFAVSFQVMNNPFFVEINEGLKEVIEAHGDELVTLDGQFNSLKQKNDISDALHNGVSGIFINPVNWEGVRGSLLQAKQEKIPAVIVDAPVKDADLVVCTVASDNVEAGRLAARALAKVKPEAKIVILHLSANKACIDRVDGFREELSKHPGMKILDTQEGKGTIEGARPVMLDLLGRYPEIDAVFPINDPSAMGAISALESVRRLQEVSVVTVDGSAEGARAVQAGKMLSTSAQFPKEIGRIAAEKMYEHLAGNSVDKDIKIRVELVTKDNADKFVRKAE